MPYIKLDELYCFYKKGKEENLVISDLSAYFPNHKINVILGPSGCGKTTLLRSILGLQDYDGDILVDGKDLYEVPIYKRKMSYINQDVSLYPHYTIFENIAFPLRNKKLERDEILKKSRQIALQFGIEHTLNVKPKYLSLGQQQRALLARELVKEPDLLLLDEPLSHLDKPLKKDILSFIREMQLKTGLTILYVTHSLYEAALIADHIYIMEEGKFTLIGSLDEILASNNSFVKALKESEGYEEKKN